MGGRSTSLQLLKVLDKWTHVLDNGGILHSIYMDFMKAFDKVPHMRLIHKIQHYGISEQTTNWIKSVLSKRQQCVQVNGSRSSWRNVNSGILQGFVLRPILFVFFINDLPNNVISDLFMFANDTKSFRERVDQSDQKFIQEDLDGLFESSKT
ncbi:unnamed protein product [Mytilus coruscus]|uniref:Reverse transcriptase domain-containing protein n=1 Tax=Mytilus coruscus TaxID=42192 RepID=A0A6J8B6T2_MYTCO|nr:unnamed protein product [Mytilus coruscus]